MMSSLTEWTSGSSGQFFRVKSDGKVGDWPKRTSYCKPSEIKETLKAAREAHMAAWRQYRGLARFVQDAYPEAFARVQACRMGQPFVEGALIGAHEVRIKLNECRCFPFCPACNDTTTWRRVMRTLNKFVACTPKGEEPLFIHAVQTAPVYERGTGWGINASLDNAGFRRMVFAQLEKIYGEGIGAVMSYHDFGERAFAKRAPHVDFTLNGWRLKDGKPKKTPELYRRDEPLENWTRDMTTTALKKWPDAEHGDGNFFIRGVVEGVPAYVKAIKYQMRELVDVKKIHYDRSRGIVEWVRYTDRGPQARMTVAEFKAGLAEYERRLHPWGAHSGGRPLDGRYGHMSDRSRSKTVEIMGGVEHDDECNCNRCRDWQRIPFDDDSTDDWSDVWQE